MAQNGDRRPIPVAFWVSLVLVTVVSWAVLRINIRTAPFHGDESGWIASSTYYTDLVLAGDATWEKWECPSCGPWGSLNPHLGQLLIGLPLKVFSEIRLGGQEFTQYYDFSQEREQNRDQGRVPPRDIWLFARGAAIVFGALTCTVAFVAGFLLVDVLTGWLFAGLLLANQLFIASATRAMTDVHYNLLLVCFLAAAAWFITRPQPSRWSSVVCGLAAGLAGSVKVTGLPIAGLVFCILIAYSLFLKRLRLKAALVHLVLFSVAALGSTYLLNPYLWPSPQRLLEMVAGWTELMESQSRISLWTTDNRFLELHQSLAHWLVNGTVLWLLVPAGLVYCSAQVWTAGRQRRASAHVVPLSYFLANYLALLLLLKLNWDRYYLPAVIAGMLLAAIALSAGVRPAIAWGSRVMANALPARETSEVEAPSQSEAPWTRAAFVLPWILVIGLSALNVIHMSRLGPNDDAYITYRVARNLAAGIGPVFNPGERVLSVTTPGYMLLLAAVSVFSQDFVRLSLGVNGLALLAVGALVIDLSIPNDAAGRRIAPPGLPSALAATVAVSITLSFPLLNASIGMETPLFIAAILAALAAYRRALQPGNAQRAEMRWLLLASTAAAAAFLLRPDGLLVAAAVGLHWIVTRRRVVWQPVALFIALSLPWLVFAWLYYGSPIPNTLVAKETQALGQAVPVWGPGLVQAAIDWARQFPVAAVFAVAGLLLALIRRQSGRWPMLLWAALVIAAHTFLGVRSYFWYYAPFAPVLGLLAGDAAAASTGWLVSRVDRQRHAALSAVVVIMALALAIVPAVTRAATLAEPKPTRNREAAYLQTAEILRDLCATRADPPWVGMGEIGLIGYVSNCPIVDFSGLLQRDVAHLRLQPLEKTAWAIQRYQPEYLVLAGTTPTSTTLGNPPWFRQRYRPVEQARVNGFLSVVYERGLGPETQRDLAGATWWQSPEPIQAPDTSLYFAPGASPAITLYGFLPVDADLTVTVDDRPVASFTGSDSGWLAARLPAMAAVDHLRLGLAGSTGDQPAMVSWVESNALPAVHYFVPMDDASIRPRPTIALEPGESRTVQLARPSEQPVALDVFYRDHPGTRLALSVDGELRDVVGGTDGWRIDHLPLPDSPLVAIELRNDGDQAVRLSYVALVSPDGPASFEE